jgi:alkylmercury lyase
MRPSPTPHGSPRLASHLSTLAAELLGRLPTMTEEERRLGLAIYRHLAQGAPLLESTLATALGMPPGAVAELLEHPTLKSLTYRDPEGRLVGFGGLAVREMPHRFEVRGRTLYTWCAWDSLFIPVILGVEARVESPAPGGGGRVRLSVAPEGVTHLEPRGAVMSFLLPSAQTFQADALKAIASFCHYIFFFPDRPAAATWTGAHPETTVISVADAFELGRLMVAERWGTTR